jgi:hypothetical protein
VTGDIIEQVLEIHQVVTINKHFESLELNTPLSKLFHKIDLEKTCTSTCRLLVMADKVLKRLLVFPCEEGDS